MSNIEWTDRTWNPVIGCTPVSPGCLNCYAATMARRLDAMGRPEYVGLTVQKEYLDGKRRYGVNDGGNWKKRSVFNGTVRTLPDRLLEPLGWKKPARVFVNSMSDLFHEAVPFDFVDKVFAVMALCPQHTFQVLTKRPERMAEYLNTHNRDESIGHVAMYFYEKAGFKGDVVTASALIHGPGRLLNHPAVPERPQAWPLPNVWLGTSVENQQVKDRIAHLRKCPAAVRFLSCEPLLEDLGTLPLDGIHWVILGAESGPKARVCNVNWLRSPMRQCLDAGVPVFMKQLGRHLECACNWNPGGWATSHGHKRAECAGCGMRLPLRDPKGADMAEWPADLRVRQFPS